MKKKAGIIIIVASLLLTFSTGMAHAEDIPIVSILKNGLYGGVIGGLLGTAALAFADTPSDHADFIGKGAAYGVFAGTIFGIYQTKDYFVSIDSNGVDYAMPAVDVGFDSLTGAAQYNVGLVEYRF